MAAAATPPQYGNAFHCIGALCETTCCQGWGILVDKATYEKYQRIPAGPLRTLVSEYVHIEKSAVTEATHARINLQSNGYCAFFSADRLCGLQKEHGEDYLSATCSIYPRSLSRVGDQLETTLYLSCPEAARNILLDENFMRAHWSASSQGHRTDQFSRVAQNAEGLLYKPYRFFHQVRECVVLVLLDRKRPMWQRVFLLGMLCSNLNDVTPEREDQLVPEILATYQGVVASGGYLSECASFARRPDAQLDIVLRLSDTLLRTGLCGERFQQCFQEFVQGVGYTPQSTPQQDLENYLAAKAIYLDPLLEKHPHIFENYLLNYVLRALFPFGREPSIHVEQQSILREFLLLATRYVLLHGLLTGIAGHQRENFGTDHVIKLVQSFSKAVDHTPAHHKLLIEFAESKGLANAGGFAILLAGM